mmetsp:Transcript_8591/g.22189  ORF Transcript_8591/g.22189 Transcript_8591/m.22189 type:complete len:257 (+) Transcript_8591:1175-1945(+)
MASKTSTAMHWTRRRRRIATTMRLRAATRTTPRSAWRNSPEFLARWRPRRGARARLPQLKPLMSAPPRRHLRRWRAANADKAHCRHRCPLGGLRPRQRWRLCRPHRPRGRRQFQPRPKLRHSPRRGRGDSRWRRGKTPVTIPGTRNSCQRGVAKAVRRGGLPSASGAGAQATLRLGLGTRATAATALKTRTLLGRVAAPGRGAGLRRRRRPAVLRRPAPPICHGRLPPLRSRIGGAAVRGGGAGRRRRPRQEAEVL